MKGLIILAQVWPCESYGGSIAVTSSLKQYCDFFDKIVFICLSSRPLNSTAQKTFNNVEFYEIPIVRESFSKRFLLSIIYGQPAITVGLGSNKVFLSIHNIIKGTIDKSDYTFVGIIEDNVPGIHLPKIKEHFPNMNWVFKGHDVLHAAFSVFKTKNNIIRRLAWTYELYKIRKFEQKAVQTADFNWTITNNDLELSERKYMTKINGVFDVGIDVLKYDLVRSGQENTIISLGSADLRKRHGIKMFIEKSWPFIRAGFGDDIRLVLGGNNTKIFDNKANGIEALGHVDDEICFLGRGKIFLNTQLSGSGLKLKSLIAMASGKVLVSFRNGVLGIGGEPGVHYIVVESHKNMAKQISFLLKNPDKMIEISKKGRQFVKDNFSEIVFSQRVQPLLNEIFPN